MEPLLRSLFRASSALPRLGMGLLMQQDDAPREAFRDVLRAIQDSAEGLRRWTPGTGNRAVLQELQNKLEAFERFRFAESFLGTPTPETLSLTERVLRAGDLATWDRIWVVEGLGYAHAGRVVEEDGPSLFGDNPLSGMTEGPVLPLHTGAGLALARRALIRKDGRSAPIIEDLARHAESCAYHARPGYADAMFEAAGLIARGLLPEELLKLDAGLADRSPELLGLLWHGVGRGMFFAPTQTLPGPASLWVAVERTRREAPHETGRLNALSGLAWAAMLVHLRHPEILAGFVVTYGARLNDDEQAAFAGGVGSACVLWSLASGYEQHLAELHRHDPDSGREVWQRLVTRPVDGVRARREAILRGAAPGALFRHPAGV